MKQKAMKYFEQACSDQKDLLKHIIEKIYKSMGINTKDDRLVEYIKDSISNFDYNITEKKLLSDIKDIILEQLKKIEKSLKNNEEINYQVINDNMIESFKSLKNVHITLEDDLKNLANQITNKFAYIGISRDDLINHFRSKHEQLCNIIQETNKIILENLIYLTPHFIDAMKEIALKKDNKAQAKIESETDQPFTEIIKNVENETSEIKSQQEIRKIQRLIHTCKMKYNETQRRISYTISEKAYLGSDVFAERSDLKKICQELDKLIQKLSSIEYGKYLINQFSTDEDINILFEKIINKEIPLILKTKKMTQLVDERHGKYATTKYEDYVMPTENIEKITDMIMCTTTLEELLKIKEELEIKSNKFDYDTNKKLDQAYAMLIDKIIILSTDSKKSTNPTPNPTPSTDTYVGNSMSDIIYLINSNQYLSLLHAINRSQIDKYSDFITFGLNIMLKKWEQETIECETLSEKEYAYYEFEKIYDNFKDYLNIYDANMLKAKLEEMKKQLEKMQEEDLSWIPDRRKKEETRYAAMKR